MCQNKLSDSHSLQQSEKYLDEYDKYIVLEDFGGSGHYSKYKMFYMVKEKTLEEIKELKKKGFDEFKIEDPKEPEEDIISYKIKKIYKF